MERKILVVRHGERCDYYFKKRGVQWLEQAFDSKGRYRRFDPQLPESLPERRNGVQQYYDDSPITQNGYSLAVKSGENLHKNGIKVNAIYASPAFRCIQTAQAILEGLKDDILIRVEPGLFQWTRWCKHGIMPIWLTPEELEKGGYSVNTSYQTIESTANFDMHESLVDYYQRSYELVKKIIQKHNKETILLVAHAGSLETLTRQLCGGAPLAREAFSQILRGTSYLSCCEADERSDHTWKFFGSPIPLLVYTGLDNCDE